MFRLRDEHLPKDPDFPADLEKLGYFVNEDDQIRKIGDPEQEFHYFISKNDRVLEMQREAMDTCIRANLLPRFHALGLQTTRLPITAGPSDPHIPILATANLSTAKRVILYLGEMSQDLGLFAYRIAGRESLATGSALNFAADVLKQGEDVALVIANVGQALWNRRQQQAMTMKSWNALPRKFGVGAPTRIGEGNKVPGHETEKAHVRSVFEFVGSMMGKEAKVQIVGICEGIEEGVRFLDQEWETWKEKVQAIVIGLGYCWDVDFEVQNQEVKDFMAKRARAYLVYDAPLNTPLTGRILMGCNVFSSGESQYTECIMPRAYPAMLDFLQLVNDVPGYEEPTMLSETFGGQSGKSIVSYVHGEAQQMGAGITFSMPIRTQEAEARAAAAVKGDEAAEIPV